MATENVSGSGNPIYKKNKVDQFHSARRRAPVKDTQTMAAIAAGLVTGWNRKDRSSSTAQTRAKQCATHAKRGAAIPLVSSRFIEATRETNQQTERSGVSCLCLSQSLPIPVHDCASFVSSSRNSNKMTFRSSLHARSPSISTRAQQKRTFGQKKDD